MAHFIWECLLVSIGAWTVRTTKWNRNKTVSKQTVLKLFRFSQNKTPRPWNVSAVLSNRSRYPLFMQNCCLSCCQSNFYKEIWRSFMRRCVRRGKCYSCCYCICNCKSFYCWIAPLRNVHFARTWTLRWRHAHGIPSAVCAPRSGRTMAGYWHSLWY